MSSSSSSSCSVSSSVSSWSTAQLWVPSSFSSYLGNNSIHLLLSKNWLAPFERKIQIVFLHHQLPVLLKRKLFLCLNLCTATKNDKKGINVFSHKPFILLLFQKIQLRILFDNPALLRNISGLYFLFLLLKSEYWLILQIKNEAAPTPNFWCCAIALALP